jgi:hypothetical protein
MANLGLDVGDVVNVGVSLSPVGATDRNFGVALFLGDSLVIDTQERFRLYTSLSAIAADLGSAAPEYLAAQTYFGQSPQPAQCYVGRWARTAASGLLRGAVLSTAQQALSNFTAITNGGLSVTVDSVPHALTALNFTAATNLNAVASTVQAALSGSATVAWDANNQRFTVTSSTTGITSAVTFATAPVSGTDISALLGLTVAAGGYTTPGIAAESLLAAVTVLEGMSNDWYGLQVASSVAPSHSDYMAVASFIEASKPSRIFGVSTQEAASLDATQTTDLASVLQGLTVMRTFIQYSSSNPQVSASIFGRAFTVDFNGNNTTLTVKFQQEPGVTPEALTETQAAALKAKNCNVFVKYNNGTAIVQEGKMCNGFFFDEVHNCDWLQNDLQTNVWNFVLQRKTKVPQTDAGVNSILTVLEGRFDQAVKNGMIAPGVWTGPPVGVLKTGDTLSKGYYVFAPPISTQSDTDRTARKAPVIQAAIKLAGAIHFVNVLVSVNR